MREVTSAQIESEQAALRRVATLVAHGVPADELFGAVAAEVGQLFGADLSGVTQYVGDASVLAVASWSATGERAPVSGSRPLDGDSISGTVFRTGRSVRRDDWDVATGTIAEECRRIGIRSSAASPIVVDDRVWGALVIHSLTARLPEGIETRMAEFTQLAGIAIADIAAQAAVRRLADEQAALRRVATLVAREAAPHDVFAAVAEEVGRLLEAGVATLHRYEDDGGVQVMAQHGDADPRLAVEGVRAPIMVDGRPWGEIVAVSRRPDPPAADAESRIAQFGDLVATAISNLETRAELAASRARLVAAADDERRRIVRDLHDGAQQRLVHTVLTINLARQAVEHSEHARELLAEASALAQRATADLRELAHGILPSVLAHGGLPAGADALASRMPVPVKIDVPGDRFAPAVEATAYFVMAEALTRVADDAGAQWAAVTARVEQYTLDVEVHDDGGGPRLGGHWTVGLEDRLAAVGGRLGVGVPGGVRATIPLDVS